MGTLSDIHFDDITAPFAKDQTLVTEKDTDISIPNVSLPS